jgi:hypothetical protein
MEADPSGAPQSSPKQPCLIEWTVEDAITVLSLPDDPSRVSYLQERCSISPEEYQFQETSTFIVDYNLANALFCEESKFSPEQTQFVCQLLVYLLNESIAAASNPTVNYDRLRLDLVTAMREHFKEQRHMFSLDQTREILKHMSCSLLRPLRLILCQFRQDRYQELFLELRKVFAPPPKPLPLSEFEEEFELPPPNLQLYRPTWNASGVPELQGAFAQYWDTTMDVLERRCLSIEDKVRALTGMVDGP